MKIYFKWPNNDNGKQFYIKGDMFRGGKEASVNDVPCEKVEANIFKYYDEDIKRDRKIEFIPRMLDNPKVEIDGKDIRLFKETAMPARVLVLLPALITILLTTNPEKLEELGYDYSNAIIAPGLAGWIKLAISLLGILVNYLILTHIKNDAIKIILYVVVTIAAFVGLCLLLGTTPIDVLGSAQ